MKLLALCFRSNEFDIYLKINKEKRITVKKLKRTTSIKNMVRKVNQDVNNDFFINKSKKLRINGKDILFEEELQLFGFKFLFQNTLWDYGIKEGAVLEIV